MKLFKFLPFLFVAAFLSLTACDDDEKENVVEGTSSFSMSGESVSFTMDGGEQTLTVGFGENWVSTYPDWVTMSPTSGHSGETEVTISVGSNYNGELPNSPRYGSITIVGQETGEEVTIVVAQDGCTSVSFAELADVSDGVAIYLQDPVIVTSIPFPDGFLVSYTDAGKSTNLMVFGSDEALNVGDEINIFGAKNSNNSLPLIIMNSYNLVSSGNAVSGSVPTDLNGKLDSYKFTQWEYVTVEGTISTGGNVTFSEDDTEVVISHSSSGIKDNYLAFITGYYAGTTSSGKVELYVPEIDYEGVAYVITLLDEDFNWLELFAGGMSDTGDSVKDGYDHGQNRVDNFRYNGVSPLNYMIDSLHYVIWTNSSNTISQPNNSYSSNSYTPLWANGGDYYFRWGSETYRSYIIFPEFEIPEGVQVRNAKLTFDLCIKSSQLNPDFRFDCLTSDYECVKSYYIEGASLLTFFWLPQSIDMSDLDFSTFSHFGVGNGTFLNAGTTCTIFIDNLKLVWIGYVPE